MQDDPDEIILPEPEGHKRAVLAFKNGVRDAVDIQDPRELGELLEGFLRDDAALTLELRDAQYGAPYILTKDGAREVMFVCTAWLKKVAPQRGSGLHIARDIPGMGRN